METIRTPKQKRAIETKNRIVRAGYVLFAEKGYYNTNTAEIAKQAGVSTGIVYGYFHDKRDILIDVLDVYVDQAFRPVLAVLDDIAAPLDFGELLPRVLDAAVETHRSHAAMHEALHALTSTDEAVRAKFMTLEEEFTRRISKDLVQAGYPDRHVFEKVHWAMDSVQSFAHECVFDRHPYIDYTILRRMVESTLNHLFDTETI